MITIGDITGFKIERCEGKGCSNFTEIASVAANVTSYQNTDLTALTSYSYRIRAYKESSHYAYSKIASATTSRSTVPPSVPKGLVANAVSASQINLSWNSEAVDPRAAGYNVYQYGERIGSTIGTSYTVKRLNPNTQYCYSVLAFDNAGNSSFQSDMACATTKPDSNSQPENKPTPALVVRSISFRLQTWTRSVSHMLVTGGCNAISACKVRLLYFLLKGTVDCGLENSVGLCSGYHGEDLNLRTVWFCQTQKEKWSLVYASLQSHLQNRFESLSRIHCC